jgi:hypothetical protein
MIRQAGMIPAVRVLAVAHREAEGDEAAQLGLDAGTAVRVS